MGSEQLGALERGDRSRLPEAVFVIAQARRVASALDLNIDALIAPLRSGPSVQRTPERPTPATSPRPLPMPAMGLGLVVALGAVAAAVALQRGSLQASLPSFPAMPWQRQGPAAEPPAKAPLPVEAPILVLDTAGRSWVEVTTADGRTLFRGTLAGRKRFPLGQGLRVLAGRPDLVTAQVGTEPARVLGSIEQVEWRRFSPAPTAPAP